jgi:hypothetical protein
MTPGVNRNRFSSSTPSSERISWGRRSSKSRRWITLIFAGWMPHYRGPSHEPAASLLRRSTVVVAKRGRGLLEYRAAPPSGNSSLNIPRLSSYAASALCVEARVIPSRPTSQIKPISSRATAMMATCAHFPLATSLRYRRHKRSCASQARSTMGLGMPSPRWAVQTPPLVGG